MCHINTKIFSGGKESKSNRPLELDITRRVLNA